MNAKKRKTTLKNVIFEVFMLVVSLIVFIPFAMMVLGSFKSQTEAVHFNLSLPSQWRFENYVEVMEKGKVIRSFFNSTFITVTAVVTCIILASVASYVLARRKGSGVRLVSNIFMLGMIAPLSMIPTIRLFQMLNITGTYFSVIMLYIAVNIPWSILIYTQFIRGIPMELDESALIDGCGPGRTFFVVIMPLLKPVTVTAIVITAMSIWNDFMIPLYFFGDSKKWTMPLTVFNFFGRYSREWNLVFANLIITALPVVILYIACQKYIVSGLTAGAVKG